MRGGDDVFVNPEDMIDHNGELNNIENFMTIFVAHNQKNIAEGKDWGTWPEWELCLTEIKHELHFEDDEGSEEIIQERKDWLALMQFIHDSDAITLNDYTISIKGKHGTQFRFELSLADEVWLIPGEIESHLEDAKNLIGKKYLPTIPLRSLMFKGIEHSLGQYWVCPEHVPKYGGKGTSFTEETLHGDRNKDVNFPADTLSLIKKCIDDTEIWTTEFEKDIKALERAEWMEENWPGGIPDQDWEYQ
jgi:hypothetical protein